MSLRSDPFARMAEDIMDLIETLDAAALKEEGRALQRALERALAEANRICRERRLRAGGEPVGLPNS